LKSNKIKDTRQSTTRKNESGAVRENELKIIERQSERKTMAVQQMFCLVKTFVSLQHLFLCS